MKTVLFISAILIIFMAKNSISQDYMYLDDEMLYKKGEYLYEFGILKIDVYQVSLFCDTALCSQTDMFSNKGSYALKFIYQRDIKSKYSKKGWEIGLKKNLKNRYIDYRSEVNWLKKITTDYKKDDEVILHINRDKLTFYKNNEILAEVRNAKLTEIVFLPWLGTNPIKKACRNNLLEM